MNLNGKVVIVTGSASGLGLTTCQQLAQQGAKIVAFDLNEATGQALMQELKG